MINNLHNTMVMHNIALLPRRVQ